jgi:hypothetical protein
LHTKNSMRGRYNQILIIIFTTFIYGLHASLIDVFEDDTYKFKWEIEESGNTIRITLDVLTTGWIGLGFAKNELMLQSTDITMCYYSIIHNKAVCRINSPELNSLNSANDFLARNNNIWDVEGTIYNGRSIISFKTKLMSDLSEEFEVLFSYRNSGNPDNEEGNYLPHSRHAIKKLLFNPNPNGRIRALQENADQDGIDNNYSMNITFDNYKITKNKTSYICKYYDLNKMVSEKTNKPNNRTYHAIQFNPIITNDDIVHHMILYGCNTKNF